MRIRTIQTRTMVNSPVSVLLAGLALLAHPGAFAQTTDTWVGNTSANLADSNWTGNNPPINGDSWIFGTAGTAGAVLNNTFAGTISVSNLLFSTGASAFTFASSANPIAVTHSITNASTALQTLNGPINITAPTTIALTAGGGDLTIGGAISGSSALRLAGTGNLTLTGISSGFSGAITNNVTLIISGAGAIGTGSAGAYTWGGSAFSNNNVLIYASSATNTFNPRTDGNGSIIVNGPGTFIPSANNSWGMSGDITVNGGILADQKGFPANGRSGLGSTAGGPAGQRYITVNGPGIVSIDATTAFGQNNTVAHNLNFVVNTNGLLRVTTGTTVFTNIYINGGTVLASGGTYDLQASIVTGGSLPSLITNTSGGFTMGMSANAGYQTPFVVNPTAGGSGAGGVDLTVTAPLQNSANNSTATGLILSGGGTMLLKSTSTFGGPVTVSQGTLILGDPGVLGSGNYAGNISVAGGATFIVNTTSTQNFSGVLSGAGTLVLPTGTLYLTGAASTVSPLALSISNGATLDIAQMSGSPALGSTIMGFGTVNGNAFTAPGALIEGGVPGSYGTLTINGNLTMAANASFVLAVSGSHSGPNSAVNVTGTLNASGTQVHLTAPSGQNLDTQNYTLVTAGSFSGSVSPAAIWDVSPLNANHYYITNINNNVVLAYSSIPIPTPGGSSSPANVLRNQTALLVVTVTPGAGTVTNVTVDASSLGGSSSLALAPNGVANTWTNSISIGPGLAPGVYLLPATATDTTLVIGNGIVSVNVIASTEKWVGLGGDQNFDTAANWAVQSGQTAAYPPAFSGDSLVFSGTANLAPVMDNTYSVKGLLFTNGAGAFNVTASGANFLTLMGAGITNLSTNLETLNLPVVSGIAGPEIVSASSGNLTLAGGFADTNGGLMVIGPTSNTFTLAGASTFSGPLTVRQGTMTLATSVTETNTVRVADTGASVAILNVGSGGSLAESAGLNLIVASGPNTTAAMTLGTGGSLAVPGTLNLGNGGASSAYFNMTGGSASIDSFVYVGQYGDHSRFDMSGGTFTITTNIMRIATELGQINQFGEANFSGGTFNSLNQESSAGYGGGLFVGEYGTGVLNVSGTAVLNVWGDTNLVVGVNTTPFGISYEGLGNGTVNLLGGSIVTAQVAGGTGISSTFNFNGGSLSNYAGSISWFTGSPGPAFMYNLLNAYVYPGGAFIDDGGGNIIVNQALKAPSGYGVPTIAVTNGGSGYIAPPFVTITGGSGQGATASAVVSGGHVTAINVTCPGSGYASGEKLNIALVGGGGSGAGGTNNALVLNGSGGLTYTSQAGAGSGMLTLTAPATYTNATIVQRGTLQIGLGGSINNSAAFVISNNATLDARPAGGFSLNANQTLKGNGTVAGVLAANSGSMIYPGVDPSVGSLKFTSGLNMLVGAAATFDLSTSGNGANDQIVINGNQSTLVFANNTIHIKALNPSSPLDTANSYVLFQNNSANALVGLPNVTPVFDVAPSNAGVGNWLIQPSGNSIVLLNSSSSPPGGSGSVTSGASNGTNIVRNTTIGVSATVSGPHSIVSVQVDLSGFGGSFTQLTHQGNTWTGTVTIPPGMPPGPFSLPIVAYDGTLYGEISLPLNVLATVETWNGADFSQNAFSDDNANWVSLAAPGYVGDTVMFAGQTGLAPFFDQNYTFNGIEFASNAGPFVLNSSAGSVSVVGGITNNSPNIETVNFALALTGLNTFFSGAAGNLVFNNVVLGTGQLNVGAGAGGVTLNGAAYYTGNTSISSGSSLTMGTNGLWVDAANNLSYAGATTNNGTFVYSSPFDQTNAGVISGPGAIIVNGPGPLTLTGANSFTGNLIINSGGTVYDPVVENSTTPTVSGLGNPQSGNTNVINSGGTLILDASGGNEFGNGSTTPLSKFVINQGGLVQINSGNAVMGPVTLNGGTLSIANTSSTQYEPYELQSITVGGNSASTISSTVGGSTSGINLTINKSAGAQMPINVASTGSSGPDLVVSVVMANSGNSQSAAGFVKTGAGTMEMTASSVFTGPMTVGAGTVLLDGIGQLNSGVYSNSIVISNGGTFTFASSSSQTNVGVLSGAGILLVSNTSGPGLILAVATNTFTGSVVVKTGALALVLGASLNSASTVSIAGGAIFDLSQLASPYVWPAASALAASGTTATPAVLNSAGAVNLSSSSGVVLTYTPNQPALNITGTLSLGGNAFTVNTVDGQPLANGTYLLIQASGNITSSGTYPLVTGTAISRTSRGVISVSGHQVSLTVSAISTVPPTMVFNLTGNVLNFSWPSDHLGYILQSNSINVAVPADWFNIAGSSSVTNFPIALQSVRTNVFFRLTLP